MAGEFDELYALSRDLGDAADASAFIRKAVQVTSVNVKDEARQSASKRREIGHAAAAIDFDLHESSDGVESEIGYRKGGVGDLGNIIEFGNPRFSPSHDLGNALLNNESDFEHGLDRAIDDALKRSNL